MWHHMLFILFNRLIWCAISQMLVFDIAWDQQFGFIIFNMLQKMVLEALPDWNLNDAT